MRRTILTLALAAALAAPWRAARAADYAVGADLSFLRQAEEKGTAFKEGGRAKPGIRIFKDHGYNWVRLRLFHTPARLPNGLEYTVAQAKEAKKLGFKFLRPSRATCAAGASSTTTATPCR
jgi:arabinogalactan endo-1,4-beta-galactosidase